MLSTFTAVSDEQKLYIKQTFSLYNDLKVYNVYTYPKFKNRDKIISIREIPSV